MRGSFVLFTSLVSMVALAGCGPTYPADRETWTLLATPNAPEEASISGSLQLFEGSEISARVLDGFTKLSTDQSATIVWEGGWTGDEEGVELDLRCSSFAGVNVEEIDCVTAKLQLSCEVDGDYLDCGDYLFW